MAIHEVDEPAAFARALFIEALRRRGVQVDASPLGENATAGLPPAADTAKLPKVAEYTSPPFREYVRVILKVSHNLYASTLPLLLAARHGERTLEAGLKRQGRGAQGTGARPRLPSRSAAGPAARVPTWSRRGRPSPSSARWPPGPSRPPSTTPCPILGRDGTLARAVAPDSPARGHAHAKTGTYWVDNELSGKAVLTSKALAGYLETASGRPLVFAFFVNNVMLDAPKPGRTVSEATAEAGRLLGKTVRGLLRQRRGQLRRPGRPTPSDPPAAGRADRAERRSGDGLADPVAIHPPPGGRPRRARSRAGTCGPGWRRRPRAEAAVSEMPGRT